MKAPFFFVSLFLSFITILCHFFKTFNMKRTLLISTIVLFLPFLLTAQNKFNGLDMNMGNLYRLSDAKTRSINPNSDLHATGAKPVGLAGYTVPAYITVDMDYEARGIPTSLGADTYTPIDEDTSILAPISQVPAGGLSSVANTAFDALDVLKFQISDSGGDAYPTTITTVKIKREYI